uniref:Protein lin-10 n=1 Tax=Anopheles merus TaxID=30066 RepID=A0A182V6A8_ANOME
MVSSTVAFDRKPPAAAPVESAGTADRHDDSSPISSTTSSSSLPFSGAAVETAGGGAVLTTGTDATTAAAAGHELSLSEQKISLLFPKCKPRSDYHHYVLSSGASANGGGVGVGGGGGGGGGKNSNNNCLMDVGSLSLGTYVTRTSPPTDDTRDERLKREVAGAGPTPRWMERNYCHLSVSHYPSTGPKSKGGGPGAGGGSTGGGSMMQPPKRAGVVGSGSTYKPVSCYNMVLQSPLEDESDMEDKLKYFNYQHEMQTYNGTRKDKLGLGGYGALGGDGGAAGEGEIVVLSSNAKEHGNTLSVAQPKQQDLPDEGPTARKGLLHLGQKLEHGPHVGLSVASPSVEQCEPSVDFADKLLGHYPAKRDEGEPELAENKSQSTGSNIIEYDGSPRRFGLNLCDESDCYLASSVKINLTSPSLLSLPRPGFPQRVVPATVGTAGSGSSMAGTVAQTSSTNASCSPSLLDQVNSTLSKTLLLDSKRSANDTECTSSYGAGELSKISGTRKEQQQQQHQQHHDHHIYDMLPGKLSPSEMGGKTSLEKLQLSAQTPENELQHIGGSSGFPPIANSSTFDYLYEFSETRKVLEEFFKCPSTEDVEKFSDYNDSAEEEDEEDGEEEDGESLDVHYDYPVELERSKTIETTYIGNVNGAAGKQDTLVRSPKSPLLGDGSARREEDDDTADVEDEEEEEDGEEEDDEDDAKANGLAKYSYKLKSKSTRLSDYCGLRKKKSDAHLKGHSGGNGGLGVVDVSDRYCSAAEYDRREDDGVRLSLKSTLHDKDPLHYSLNGDGGDGRKVYARKYSKNFNYSPDTTDYDSNCGDYDSEISPQYGSDFGLISGNGATMCDDLNNGVISATSGAPSGPGESLNCLFANNANNYTRYYAAMPVLEDGLSSGHVSDSENNLSANPMTGLLPPDLVTVGSVKQHGQAGSNGGMMQSAGPATGPGNQSRKAFDKGSLCATGDFPDPLGPVGSGTVGTAGSGGGAGTGPSLSPIWIPRTRASDDFAGKPLAGATGPTAASGAGTLSNGLQPGVGVSGPSCKLSSSPVCSKPVAVAGPDFADETDVLIGQGSGGPASKTLALVDEDEDPDTDLETDRLLGHQRLDDQGFYDESGSGKLWSTGERKTGASRLLTLGKVSPKQQQQQQQGASQPAGVAGGAARDTAANGKLPASGPLGERLTGTVGVRNGPQPNGSAGGSSFLPGGGGSGSSTGMAGTGASVPLPDLGIAASASLPPASGAPSTANGGAGGTASAKSAKPPSGNLINFNGPNEPQTQLTSPNPSPQHSLGEGNLLDKSNDSGSPGGSTKSKSLHNNDSKRKSKNKEVLIEGVLFRARYLGSTQLVCEGQPTKSTRMLQAEEAVSRIKSPDGEVQPSTEVDLFISTEKIMVLNTDLKEIMMDHALRTISYIADIGDLVVLMARRRFVPQDVDSTDSSGGAGTGSGTHTAGHGAGSGSTPSQKLAGGPKGNRTPKMICHVFESEEAQFIAQSIGQAFQVAYMEFLKANGIEDHSFMKEIDYQEVLNSQEIFGDELEIFAKKELQKEVVVPKAKGEILGVVIVESGWGSMLPTVVIANLASAGAAARCGQLNIGDQIIAINGLSLVGLPLSTCQGYIKNTKNQTVVKFTVVPCAPVVEVKIKRPNTKYQLGFSVQNGVICSLLRGGIAERGGVRVGHRIIEINNQSVVAVPHEKIVNLLATSVGEILMKTMPTSMFRLLTGQENPIYI